MENYSFTSYPDSGDSSPRSREIEFENPPPWDDQSQQPPQNYKAKFMCSYGGKILPRPHDNQLAYHGGETKILAVDRNIKFDSMISKLSALCGDADVSFKYQLPGEDLDALISVSSDDDLEHMMHEYDRLYRASAKPVRMRLFLFQAAPMQSSPSFGSEGVGPHRDMFVEALNSGPTEAPKAPTRNDVDFLFGMDKVAPPPQTAVKLQDSVPEPVAPPPPEFSARVNHGDRVVGSEPVVHPVEIQRQLQDQLQRLQIAEHEPPMMFSRKSDDNLVGAYSGDYYVPKVPEKAPTATLPVATGFWPENQFSTGGFPANAPDQRVYMIPAPGTVYHAAPMVRPMTPPTTQGYYTMQRVSSEVYRDQPVYNVHAPPPSQPPPMTTTSPPVMPSQPTKMSAYTEGYGMVRPSGSGVVGMADTAAYAPMAYDGGVGRQVYYAAATAPYHGASAAVSTDTRPGGGLGQENKKVVNRVSQASV